MPMEERTPGLRGALVAVSDEEIDMNLKTPEKVEKLQKALHVKAKEAPQFRFYLLYDKVYRSDILSYAYRMCRANGGAAGVDGETFEQVESYGREAWLGEWLEADDIVGRLNRLLNGWGQYFCLGPVSKAYRVVDAHTSYRLRQWLCIKYKHAGQGTTRYPDEYLYSQFDLVRLSVLTRDLPWAKA
jgi:Group II intron, maturase-specific domain